MKNSFILISLLLITITITPASCGWFSDLFKTKTPSAPTPTVSPSGTNLVTDPDGDYTQRITKADTKFFDFNVYSGPFSAMTKLSLFGTYEGRFLNAKKVYYKSEPSTFSWMVNTWFRKSAMTSTIIFKRGNTELFRRTVSRKNNDNSWFDTDYVFEYTLDPNVVNVESWDSNLTIQVIFDDKTFSFSTLLVTPDAILRTAEPHFDESGYLVLPLIFSDIIFDGAYTIECNIYDNSDNPIAHVKNTENLGADNSKALLRIHRVVVGALPKWTIQDFNIRSSRGGYVQAGTPHFALNL
jgi:hypothetical protein